MGYYILQIVIVIILVINYLYWKYSKIDSVWEKLIGIGFLTVATGTPIIFTSLTRSVFEVSKLLNLRLMLLWIAGIVLTRAIVTGEKIKLLKTPLNWPILAFAVVNIISAIQSSNHYIALLGAYDRWEGLITELNYMIYVWFFINFVKDKKTIYWLIGSLLVGALLSAIYGIFQANDLDFMHWSVDPTARVFGCINNPVHYAPYIMMHAFLLIGFLFFLIKSWKLSYLKLQTKGVSLKDFFIKNQMMLAVYFILLSIIILYYVSGYLSFGRATWIGASMAITFILYFIYLKDSTRIFKDLFFLLLGIFLVNTIEVFKIYSASHKFIPILVLAGIVYLLNMYLEKARFKEYLLYTLFVIYGGTMQFTMVNIWYLLLNLGIGFVLIKYYPEEEKLVGIIKSFLIIMMIAVVAVPSYKNLYASIDTSIKSTLKGSDYNVSWKAASYASDFQKGTARTSMWKTGFMMWKDWPIWGIGPCMIKEMYPKYRRADYGRLEGGQNYTPDKLHNDYVNMLATRGLAGFIVYYLWLLPLAGYMMLKKIKTEGLLNSPGNYLIAGLFAGLFVYLGQVIFNFGVVATRLIFYEFFCLALVIVIYDPFKSAKP